jgi:hypothetical protein
VLHICLHSAGAESVSLLECRGQGLDVSKLSQEQFQKLTELYIKMSMQDLLPIPTQFQQAAQKQGWRYEVDQALVEIVTGESKDLTPIYEMLAREPIICLKPLG